MTLRERVRTTRSVADQWYATEGRPIRMRTVYHRLPHDGRQRVRRLRGERNNFTFAVERHVHPYTVLLE
ncbi:unnamed protein product [Tenebrio molitor]|nr:unnamed protein product [Tenebrio molitor]